MSTPVTSITAGLQVRDFGVVAPSPSNLVFTTIDAGSTGTKHTFTATALTVVRLVSLEYLSGTPTIELRVQRRDVSRRVAVYTSSGGDYTYLVLHPNDKLHIVVTTASSGSQVAVNIDGDRYITVGA